jgi:aryl-alcohol dehydrogenase
MRPNAAIVDAPKGRFRLAQVDVAAPAADEVRVRIVAVGICHTDLAVRDGKIPGVPMPAILGHEGAGVVEAVGSDVQDLARGDHVVLSYAFCGSCKHCSRNRPFDCDSFYAINFLTQGGAVTFPGAQAAPHSGFFGQSSFATNVNVKARYAVKAPADISLERLALLGCGVLTGAGTVLNGFRPGPGASLAVFGAGAVGLSAVMAAKVARCATIVAIDRVRSRLDLASELGATHVIDAADGDLVKTVRAIVPRGADFVLDTTGVPEVVGAALASVERRGSVVLVAGTPGQRVSLDMGVLLSGATVRMLAEGGSVPRETIPQLIELHRGGQLPFERLIAVYPFEEINEAAQDAADGKVIKAVLRMPGAHDERGI